MINSTTISKKILLDNKIITITFITVIIYVMPVNVLRIMAYAQIAEIKDKILTTGRIDSSQKDVDGNTTWLLSGNWKSNMFANTKFNDSNPAKFSATINMVMTNGSEPHKHKISDFSLSEISTEDNVTLYKGTLSVSMKHGPVFGIPFIIRKFQNDIISISLEGITSDQLDVVSRIGGTPILGTFTN